MGNHQGNGTLRDVLKEIAFSAYHRVWPSVAVSLIFIF